MRSIPLYICCLLLSCDSTSVPDQNSNSEEPTTQSRGCPPLPQYSSVEKMLEETNDFSVSDKTLKVISCGPLHIQVSKEIFEGDLAKNIEQQTKRDIIYVAFQAFALTDIDTLLITSVPILFSSKKEQTSYSLTTLISRNKANQVLQKHLGSENYTDLFECFQNTSWVPSKKFDLLKFDLLDKVFLDLKMSEL